MNTTRREFLRLSAMAGASALLLPRSSWCSMPRGKDDRRLVLLFLDGGNDGLNTIAPYVDDLYQKARPQLGLSASEVLRLDDHSGLHPELSAWQPLFENGSLSVIQGVGYDRPNLSHFTSRDIWHSGERAIQERPSGWVGRAFEKRHEYGALPPVAVGISETPLLLKSEQTAGLTMRDLSSLQIDATPRVPQEEGMSGALARIGQASQMAYETAEKLHQATNKIPAGTGYPDSSLADRLRLTARLIRAENGPSVCWAKLGGFDTHALQNGTHRALLRQLGDATSAFQADLARDGSDQKTLLLIYSEFGRRVAENGSVGTDHGTAGPMFAFGADVQGGFLGHAPDLSRLKDGNLHAQIDFRQVFSEALRDWLGWSAAGVFDGAFSDGTARAGYLRSGA